VATRVAYVDGRTGGWVQAIPPQSGVTACNFNSVRKSDIDNACTLIALIDVLCNTTIVFAFGDHNNKAIADSRLRPGTPTQITNYLSIFFSFINPICMPQYVKTRENVTSSTNRKYITYRIVIREEPSHGHHN